MATTSFSNAVFLAAGQQFRRPADLSLLRFISLPLTIPRRHTSVSSRSHVIQLQTLNVNDEQSSRSHLFRSKALETDVITVSGELGLDGIDTGAPASAPSPPLPKIPSPELTVKEKKELASFAHGLGKKLKSQQVGKGGVTAAVAASFSESLEANELLKLKVHGSCPGELNDVIKQLEQSTGSVAVSQIGRSVILYRPSISKMKKKEIQNFRNSWNAKSTDTIKLQKRRQVPVSQFR